MADVALATPDDEPEKTEKLAFDHSWDGSKASEDVAEDGYYALRPWQLKGFEAFKDKRCMLLNAPMGSGKSRLMCAISADRLERDPRLRVIIAVPQTVIANGFADAKLLMPNGDQVDWHPGHDLCAADSASTIAYVLAFLEGKFTDRILLCTHATLVGAYKRLIAEDNLDLLRDLLLWIDEAHHLCNAEVEGETDVVLPNRIGDLARHVVLTDLNTQVGLSTATFFRGDRLQLITPDMEEHVCRYELAFDAYLESLPNLRSFSYKFMLCEPDFADAIERLVRLKRSKDIIHIPHPMSRHSTGDKYAEVERILGSYRRVLGGELVDEEDGTTSLGPDESPFIVLDLVDEDRREEKKILTRSINEDRDALDSIIALGMFKEGANWIWADRSIIVGARSSLVDVVQIIGRLFRDAPGKEHVDIVHLLPFGLDQVEDPDKLRDTLNEHLKAIYMSLILEDVLVPAKLPKLPEPREDGDEAEESDASDDPAHRGFNRIRDYVPDASQRLTLIRQVGETLIQTADEHDGRAHHEDYVDAVSAVIAGHGIGEGRERLAELIIAMFRRLSARMGGIDVKEIDIELLSEVDPAEFAVHYSSGINGISTLRDLRLALAATAKLYASMDQVQEALRRMRAAGQPIDNREEYLAWEAAGYDYEAVLRMRKREEDLDE